MYQKYIKNTGNNTCLWKCAQICFCPAYPQNPRKVLTLLHMAIEPILANEAILDKGCAMFLQSKSHVASAAFFHPVKRAEALQATIENLNEAKNDFANDDCREWIRDVTYLQDNGIMPWGKTQERNQCVTIFQQLHQELPSPWGTLD